mgnify:CR=1 FL=1
MKGVTTCSRGACIIQAKLLSCRLTHVGLSRASVIKKIDPPIVWLVANRHHGRYTNQYSAEF